MGRQTPAHTMASHAHERARYKLLASAHAWLTLCISPYLIAQDCANSPRAVSWCCMTVVCRCHTALDHQPSHGTATMNQTSAYSSCVACPLQFVQSPGASGDAAWCLVDASTCAQPPAGPPTDWHGGWDYCGADAPTQLVHYTADATTSGVVAHGRVISCTTRC